MYTVNQYEALHGTIQNMHLENGFHSIFYGYLLYVGPRWQGANEMRTVIGAFLCSLMFVSSVHAADSGSAMTGGDLQDICTASSPDSKAACRFYILGITQGLSMGMNIADGKTKGGRPCIPDDTSSLTLELMVKMKLGQDLMVFPDDKKLDASGLIGAILVSTFPCRKAR